MKSPSPYGPELFAEDKYLKQELKTRWSGFVLEFWHDLIHNNTLDIIKTLTSENPLVLCFPPLNASTVHFICDWALAHFLITGILKATHLCISVLLFSVYIWIEKNWDKKEQELGRLTLLAIERMRKSAPSPPGIYIRWFGFPLFFNYTSSLSNRCCVPPCEYYPLPAFVYVIQHK